MRTFFYPNLEVVPRRLAGNRVGIGKRAFLPRQQLGNQVIQQKALGGFWRFFAEAPGADKDEEVVGLDVDADSIAAARSRPL